MRTSAGRLSCESDKIPSFMAASPREGSLVRDCTAGDGEGGGALRAMHAPTSTAEDAECAEEDRLTVASHLVCDAGVRRRRQAPTLPRLLLAVLVRFA
jgi:hypothetical protein